ncbi:hypothetical protein C8Q79DRAFT_392646 [Trametes meyenii]|nr:hypothetical protein C8Q79DRAFT_392646 [Trametes meyenii]
MPPTCVKETQENNVRQVELPPLFELLCIVPWRRTLVTSAFGAMANTLPSHRLTARKKPSMSLTQSTISSIFLRASSALSQEHRSSRDELPMSPHH